VKPKKEYVVTLNKAAQFGGHHKDGKLVANTDNYTLGNGGEEYKVELPTGEQIFFRNASKTHTLASQQGRVRIVIPNHDDQGGSQASMERAQKVLSAMGLDFGAADHTSAENTYWREMADVFLHRDSGSDKRYAGVKQDLKQKAAELGVKGTANHFSGDLWEKFHEAMTPEEESHYWHDLYGKWFGSSTVDEVVNEEKYLPKFDHHNYADPTAETGKPYWDRFDVTDEEILNKGKFLMAHFYHGDSDGAKVADTGGYFSTEARLRLLGVYGSMMSSESDQSNGAARFTFTRISSSTSGKHIVFNPLVMKRTRTYSYNGDNFGTKSNIGSAPANPKNALGYSGGGNETMVEDGLTMLDHMEFMIFDDANARNEAIQKLKAKGIEKIRDLPVEDRLVMRNKVDEAIQKLKESWKKK
jgi:hypothetical protein